MNPMDSLSPQQLWAAGNLLIGGALVLFILALYILTFRKKG